MEDDLKIFIVEYLSNLLLDHTQILNLSFYDKPYFVNSLNEYDLKWKTTLNIKSRISQQWIWIWPQIEDDLKC